jgi:hypothetical protein
MKLTESQLRKIIREALIKEALTYKYPSEENSGSTWDALKNLASKKLLKRLAIAGVGIAVGGKSSPGSNDTTDTSTNDDVDEDFFLDEYGNPYEIDDDKIKSAKGKKVDLRSVDRMSQDTGLRPDFIFGLQARESAGNPSAMALNPKKIIRDNSYEDWVMEKLRRAPSGKYTRSYWESARQKMIDKGVTAKTLTTISLEDPTYLKMRDVDPEMAIVNAALGFYQVLGAHIIHKYNFDADQLISHWESDPKGFSEGAFVIWVNDAGGNKFKNNVKNENTWRQAVGNYYGEDGTTDDYTAEVQSLAKEYRDAMIRPEEKDSSKNPNAQLWIPGQKMASQENFHEINCTTETTPNYRSGDPVHWSRGYGDSVQFYYDLYAFYGLNTLITLNGDSRAPAYAKQAGWKSIVVKLGTHPPNNTEWNTIKAAMDKGGALVHCTHGADRTGAVVARWEYETGCKTPQKKTYDDSLQYGFKKPDHPGYGGGPPDPNKHLRNWMLK